MNFELTGTAFGGGDEETAQAFAKTEAKSKSIEDIQKALEEAPAKSPNQDATTVIREVGPKAEQRTKAEPTTKVPTDLLAYILPLSVCLYLGITASSSSSTSMAELPLAKRIRKQTQSDKDFIDSQPTDQRTPRLNKTAA